MEKRFCKSIILIFMLSLATAPATVSAANFSYYASSLFSQSGAMVSNTSETVDPGPVSDWSHEEVNSSQEAETQDGNINAYGSGFGVVEMYNSGCELQVTMEGNANGNSTDSDGHLEGYGGTSTVQSGVTTGIYFELVAGPNEQIGDPVQIDFQWTGDAEASDGTSAKISGGFAGDTIAITLNDYPALTTFDLTKAVWTMDGVSVENGNGYQNMDDGSFTAAIGDIVGIHMGVYADVNWDGEGYEMWAMANQNLSMIVTEAPPVPIPGAVWLLGSGLFGLAAIRRKKKSS